MNQLIHAATAQLSRYLADALPRLSPDWWQKHVVDRLSYQQQRILSDRGQTRLDQLDFAALIRVLDQNWYELSQEVSLPREGRNWVKEMQTVRNKWAHLPPGSIPPSEIYRDADTLSRLLVLIKSDEEALAEVEKVKAIALAHMSGLGPTNEGDGPSDGTTTGSGQDGPASRDAACFQPGQLVALRSDPQLVMPVLEVLQGGSETRYRVFRGNLIATYYESQLQPTVAEAGARSVLSVAGLAARLTSLQILSPSTTTLFSLRSGRVQFIPYQYRPVLKLIRADRPRLLIADEVGVGKTIEAGLIIKELRARTDISSILILCPKALVAERKWDLEMRRFDEHFTALDGNLLRHCLRETDLEGEWPEQYAKVILPFSLLDSELLFGRTRQGRKREEGLLKLDPPPQFDLVIVDEAHHIRNTETYVHQGVRFFTDNASAVLFLTATPVQLGSRDLFTLLNGLRPDLIIDPVSFEEMGAPNRFINAAVHSCRVAKEDWQEMARVNVDEAGRTQWGRLFLRETPAFQDIYDKLREPGLGNDDRVALIGAIEGLYTFSSLISRTRRRDIGEFTTRKPSTREVSFTPEQQTLHDDLLDTLGRILVVCHGRENVKFFMATVRRQAASCLFGLVPLLEDMLAGKLDKLELMEVVDDESDIDLGFVNQIRDDVEGILSKARNLPPQDPKLDEFLRILSEKSALPNNKSLVFSTFRHTLTYLSEHLAQGGYRYGVIHGSVPDDDRAELRRRFALPPSDRDAIDVLLSSEVGCEGLDFQFCDLIVNYDLPWNPMRIEQRIGRIDRFGQKSETVAVVNLITTNTVDADIYERCLWRIGVFHHAVGGSEEVLGSITRELHGIADNFDLTSEERRRKLQQLADNSIRLVREEYELEAKEAELFGLAIPRKQLEQEIASGGSAWLSPSAFEHAVSTYLAERLDARGQYLLGDGTIKTLRLNLEARARLLEDYRTLPRSTEPIARDWERWLKGNQPTLAVTFHQQAAMESTKTVYLSVFHPLMRQTARFLELTEPAYVAVSTSHPDLPLGEHHFALYRWNKRGVRPDEALVAVATEPAIEAFLLSALSLASDADIAPPTNEECDVLDGIHYHRWAAAQADHIESNKRQVEQLVQSLEISHRARCMAIEDQITRASDARIRLMKESELGRASIEFAGRMKDLERAANSGDIHGTPVVFGTLVVAPAEAG